MSNGIGYRRICLYGGPGSGKSEIASWLYSNIKQKMIEKDSKHHIESASEYVKRWAYQKVDIKKFDQIYIFGKQMRTVELPLRNGVDYVVTDSPMPLQVCFSWRNNLDYALELESMSMWFEQEYPGIHIFIDRDSRKYYPEGRYEDEKGARDMDLLIQKKVPQMFKKYETRFSHNPNLVNFSYQDKDGILQHVLDRIQI